MALPTDTLIERWSNALLPYTDACDVKKILNQIQAQSDDLAETSVLHHALALLSSGATASRLAKVFLPPAASSSALSAAFKATSLMSSMFSRSSSSTSLLSAEALAGVLVALAISAGLDLALCKKSLRSLQRVHRLMSAVYPDERHQRRYRRVRQDSPSEGTAFFPLRLPSFAPESSCRTASSAVSALSKLSSASLSGRGWRRRNRSVAFLSSAEMLCDCHFAAHWVQERAWQAQNSVRDGPLSDLLQRIGNTQGRRRRRSSITAKSTPRKPKGQEEWPLAIRQAVRTGKMDEEDQQLFLLGLEMVSLTSAPSDATEETDEVVDLTDGGLLVTLVEGEKDDTGVAYESAKLPQFQWAMPSKLQVLPTSSSDSGNGRVDASLFGTRFILPPAVASAAKDLKFMRDIASRLAFLRLIRQHPSALMPWPGAARQCYLNLRGMHQQWEAMTRTISETGWVLESTTVERSGSAGGGEGEEDADLESFLESVATIVEEREGETQKKMNEVGKVARQWLEKSPAEGPGGKEREKGQEARAVAKTKERGDRERKTEGGDLSSSFAGDAPASVAQRQPKLALSTVEDFEEMLKSETASVSYSLETFASTVGGMCKFSLTHHSTPMTAFTFP